MLRSIDGQPVCVTVTHLDGLVLARSGFNHSVNYRSAMVLGTAHLVTDDAETDASLEALLRAPLPGPLAGAAADDRAGAQGDRRWPGWTWPRRRRRSARTSTTTTRATRPGRPGAGSSRSGPSSASREPDPFTPEGIRAARGPPRGLTRRALTYRFSTSQSRSSAAAIPSTGSAPAGQRRAQRVQHPGESGRRSRRPRRRTAR